MARSLIGGLIARGWRAEQIVVADPVAGAARGPARAIRRARARTTIAAAARDADIVVLAVKPQEMRRAADGIRHRSPRRRPLLISVAAGIRASDIQRWCGGIPVVRCMPNRPALQGCGMTGLYRDRRCLERSDARRPSRSSAPSARRCGWSAKQHMDIVTAVSGSGPAYFFLLIEMLEQAGIALGLPPDVSRKLAIETAYGSGCMAREASESPAVLREQVTSKGGTTEAALQALEAQQRPCYLCRRRRGRGTPLGRARRRVRRQATGCDARGSATAPRISDSQQSTAPPWKQSSSSSARCCRCCWSRCSCCACCCRWRAPTRATSSRRP